MHRQKQSKAKKLAAGIFRKAYSNVNNNDHFAIVLTGCWTQLQSVYFCCCFDVYTFDYVDVLQTYECNSTKCASA